MTCVSVVQAAHHLGIDVKTLHRWLADAQLAVQSHPHDGRKKGMSRVQLHQLARLHQRSLAGLPLEPPAPHPDDLPARPAALLELPEQLSTLQAQISALHQQVADLTLLLKPQLHPPVSQTAPTKPSKRPPKPTSPAPRSRPAAKPPRKPAHVLPRVPLV